MGLIDFLDSIAFSGKENFNRDNNGNQTSGYKSEEEGKRVNYLKKETREEALKKELDKYNHGHVFKLGQVPKIIQDEVTLRKKDLEIIGGKGEDLKKIWLYREFRDNPSYILESIFALYTAPFTNNFLVVESKRYTMGVEEVKNDQNEYRLRVFKESENFLG